MSARDADAFPRTDAELPAFLDDLGLSGIVDLHVHAMPERLQEAVWRFFDRLEDPPWPIRYREEADARLDHLARIGVERHTALAYAHRPGMLGWLNDHTLGLADAREAVVPTFTIHPDPDVDEQTARAIARGGAVVKVHTQVGRFHTTDPRLDGAWQQIAAARLPVVLHATAVYGVAGGDEYCGIDTVRALLDRHPDLCVVVAHLGMPDYADAVALARGAPQVHLDTAMTLHDGPVSERVPPEVVEALGELSDRVVFGSDYPSIPHEYAAQVRALARLGLDDDGLRALLSGNARRLLAAVGG